MNSAQKIADLLYKTYPDILIKSIVPENQVINLINRIMAHKKSSINKLSIQMPSPSNKNVNPINTTEVFPMPSNNSLYAQSTSLTNPENALLNSMDLDDSGKKGEKSGEYYSKSNQNFFSSGKNSNINFVDETSNPHAAAAEVEADFKAELEHINNKNKNRYNDEDNDYVNVNYDNEEM